MPSLNLKYAKKNCFFFHAMNEVKETIAHLKQKNSSAVFNQKDEQEIGRGKSYDVFADFNECEAITIKSFRKSLNKRGVSGLEMQNKILNLILQNRIGVHFQLANLVNNLFLGNDFNFAVDGSNYNIELAVNGADDVDLVFKAKCKDVNRQKDAMNVNVKVNITPAKVVITDLVITKLAESANSAFKFLQSNQQNILMKLITLIKRALGFDSEFIIEQSGEDGENWANSPGI